MFRFPKCLHLVIFFFGLGSIAAVSYGDDKVIVYRANLPVTELAKVLGDAGDEVSFRAVRASNTLIVSANEGSIEKILTVLEQIDPKPQSVRIHAFILTLADVGDDVLAELTGRIGVVRENIKSLTKSQRITSVARVQLTTLNQQPTLVQIGERKAVESATLSRNGRDYKQHKFTDVGSSLGVTPRLGRDNCQLEVELERSMLQPSSDDSPSGTTEWKLNTTVSVPLGSCIEVQRMRDSDFNRHNVLIIGIETIE